MLTHNVIGSSGGKVINEWGFYINSILENLSFSERSYTEAEKQIMHHLGTWLSLDSVKAKFPNWDAEDDTAPPSLTERETPSQSRTVTK